MRWFRKVFVADSSDQPELVMDACDWFETKTAEVRQFISDRSATVEAIAMKIPGMQENAYGNLQELESILELVETNENREKLRHTKRFLEAYKKISK